MLTKKDKEWITQAIREEFMSALKREVTIVKAPRGPGEPEVKQETSTMNLLDLMGQYLPFVEGALRGVQKDANQARNRATESLGKLDAIGNLMAGLEHSITTMARFAITLHETGLLKQLEVAASQTQLLEEKNESDT